VCEARRATLNEKFDELQAVIKPAGGPRDAAAEDQAAVGTPATADAGLCAEPGITGRIVVKLPYLADAAVPNMEDVRGILVHPVAAALGELVM
jgi:hypothetical protein